MEKGDVRSVVVRGSADGFAQEIRAGRHRIRADEPASAGGTDTGLSPYDLLLAAFGECAANHLGRYSRAKAWPPEDDTVHLRLWKIYATDCAECQTKEVMLD